MGKILQERESRICPSMTGHVKYQHFISSLHGSLIPVHQLSASSHKRILELVCIANHCCDGGLTRYLGVAYDVPTTSGVNRKQQARKPKRQARDAA